MNMITKEELDKCLEYCDITKISTTDYGTFIRALVYTVEKDLPVEIIDNTTKNTIKAKLEFFSIEYKDGQEGSWDSININYTEVGGEALKYLRFDRIGKGNVVKDKKSGTRTFYRYYINSGKDTGYRFTFNRRISKD